MALAVIGALAFAVPVGAAVRRDVDPPGSSAPTTPTTDEPSPSSSSSTSTTSTTKPGKKPPKKPTTTTTTAPAAPAAPVDENPTAGPPELAKAGVVLPDDSMIAAVQELALERAKVDLMGSRRTQLEAKIVEHESKLTKVRASYKREAEQRVDRAVATYRGQSSGWELGVIVEHGLDQEREVYLVAAADEAARKKLKSLKRSETELDLQLTSERADRVKIGEQLTDAVANVNRLLDKLAASNGTIMVIDGVLTYVPTGPSPVALLADAADQELSRLILTKQPLATDAKWLAASHDLAVEISKGKSVAASTPAGLEAAWAATPPDVVHAMLFALRQVGKAYVYATAGPVTFDCSGLTKAAYAQLHLGLPHFSGAQLHLGVPVTPETLRAGDLLTYGPDGSEHVTMYIGDGLVVEAKGRAYGVIVAPARVDPTKGFAGATRIVP